MAGVAAVEEDVSLIAMAGAPRTVGGKIVTLLLVLFSYLLLADEVCLI